MLDVVAVLEGVPSPAECTQRQCASVDMCGASPVWFEARRALKQVLGHISIGDLLAREDALRVRALTYEV